MTDWYILNENNEPVVATNIEEYRNWRENNSEKKVVKQEEVNGRFISTVFLGLNHNFNVNGPPMLFETMVFPKKGDWGEIYMERCHDYEEAQDMHQKAVQWVLDGENE